MITRPGASFRAGRRAARADVVAWASDARRCVDSLPQARCLRADRTPHGIVLDKKSATHDTHAFALKKRSRLAGAT